MAGRGAGGVFRHTVLAYAFVGAALALRGQGVVERGVVGALPGFGEAQGKHLDRFTGEGVAGAHPALPVNGEAAPARTAPDSLSRSGMLAAGIGQALGIAVRLGDLAFERLTELQHGDVVIQRCVRQIAAGFLAGLHEAGVDGEGQALLMQEPDHVLAVLHELVGGDGNAQRDLRCIQPPDVLQHLAECPLAGDPLVGFLAGAVQGNLHRRWRIHPQEVHHFCIHQQTVGQDAHLNALAVQEVVQLFEAGVGQALAAGETGVHHAGVDRLLHDVLPLGHRQQLRAVHLRFVQMDVAHLAVQVAQRGQFKAAGDGDVLLPGLEIQEFAYRFIAAVIGNTLLVQLLEQRA